MKNNAVFGLVLVLLYSGELMAQDLDFFEVEGVRAASVFSLGADEVAYGANPSLFYSSSVSEERAPLTSLESETPLERSSLLMGTLPQISQEEINLQTSLVKEYYPQAVYLGATGEKAELSGTNTIVYGRNRQYNIIDGARGSFRITNDLLWFHPSGETYFAFSIPSQVRERFPEPELPQGLFSPPGYSYLGREGETLFLPGAVEIAYGANGTYAYLLRDRGYVTINNSMAGDPVPGVPKHGFYRIIPSETIPDYNRGSTFTEENANRLFGEALRNGNYQEFYRVARGYLNRRMDEATSVQGRSRLLEMEGFYQILDRVSLLQRLGVDHVSRFVEVREQKDFLGRVLGDDSLIQEFLLAGPIQVANPDTDHGLKTLEIWYRIYQQDPDIFHGWKSRLAMATALAFTADLKPYHSGNSDGILPIDPLVRYIYYRDSWLQGQLFPEFEELDVWRMRFVVTAWATEQDITWARQMIRTMRPDLLNRTRVHDAAGLMPYSGNLDYPNNYKDLMTVGGVCGAISFFGSLANQAFGIPALNMGQPRHAAFAFMDGEDHWDTGNDIFGWRASWFWYIQGIDLDMEGNIPMSYLLLETRARSDQAAYLQARRYQLAANVSYHKENAQDWRWDGIGINNLDFALWEDAIRTWKTMDMPGSFWNNLMDQYTQIHNNLADQQLAFFQAINTPAILGAMDRNKILDYAYSIQSISERGGFERFNSQFAGILKIIENKALLETNTLRPHTLTATDSSHQQGEPAANLVDGRIGTGGLWHSEYARMGSFPQSVDVSFDQSYRINRVVYVPRQDGGSNGRILDFEYLATRDGRNYFPIGSGTWENNPERKTEDFGNQELRGIRLIVRNGHGGFASGDELIFYTNQSVPPGSGRIRLDRDLFPSVPLESDQLFTGSQNEILPNSPSSQLISISEASDLNNSWVVPGYTGTPQLIMRNNSSLRLPLPEDTQGNYRISLIYATSWDTANLTVNTSNGNQSLGLTNSHGLWRQSNPIDIRVSPGQAWVELRIQGVEWTVLQGILLEG